MAAKSTPLSCAVIIKHKTGVDKTGKDVIESERISNVNTGATDQQIYDTVTAIGTLYEFGLDELERVATSGITNVGA